MPDRAQHLGAHESTERSAEPPREREPFAPREPRATRTERPQREPPLAADHADVTDTHRSPGPPTRDLHLVEQTERTDAGVAVEGRADAATPPRGDPDVGGVLHPLHV